MADKRMTEDDLRRLVDLKMANSVGSGTSGDLITKDRLKAEKYYRGEPFGDERPGHSKVVSRDVAEAVDSMMPSLMKIFSAGDEVVTFNATKAEEEAAAAQATDYVNWIWNQQNDGYANFHAWIKDALLKKLGTVKIWWEESARYTRDSYANLDDGEFQALLTDDDLELLEHTATPDPSVPAPPPELVAALAAQGIPAPPPAMLHDCVTRRRHHESRVRVAPVPPDETLIDHQAGADELPWGNRRRTTVADLIEEFPDKEEIIKALPWEDGHDLDIERTQRFADEGQMTRDHEAQNPLMREIWVVDAYFRVDFDGDGYAEMRKVTTAGVTAGTAGALLDNVEYDDNPFACITPIPLPHKLIGMSIADQVMEIQLIKSTLNRQALDNVYLQHGTELVVTGEADLDALMNRRPGNVIRAKAGTTVVPLAVPPMLNDIMESISYFDTVRDQRTGATRTAPGPGADSLNNAYTQTAAGAAMVETAGQERIAYIARTFAETGVKRAFRRIFELTCKHQNKAQVIKLRGQWVPINPTEWNDRMNLTVTVGLGTNNKTVAVQQLMTLFTQVVAPIVQAQGGLNGPVVYPENLHHLLIKIPENMGFKGSDQFFPDPTQQQQQQKPEPPNEALIKAQADLHKTQMTTQSAERIAAAKIQSEERQAQLKVAADRELGYAKIAVDNKAIDSEVELKTRQHETDTLFKAAQHGHQVNKDHVQLAQGNRAMDQADAKQEADAQRDTLKLTAPTGGSNEITGKPPKPPKGLKAIAFTHDASGMVAAAKRHFDDGTSEDIPITRTPAPAGAAQP
jgi:hypothetical protein